MKPDENNDTRPSSPLIPQRSFLTPSDAGRAQRQSAQTAAAQLVRDQINHLYDGNTTTPTPQTTPHYETTTETQASLTVQNPYARTHTDTPEPQAEQWKQYHSAWQQYYQKYYERYYIGQLHQAQQQGDKQQTATQSVQGSEEVSRDEALYDLRNHLRQKVTSSAKQARNSRHFVPVTAALSVALIFCFLQYNRVLFANVQAYIMPGNIEPQNIIVDPNAAVEISNEPKLIIPKINVDVPVVYGVGNDHDSQMEAMESGVAHFSIPGASSVPGQVGNTVIAGHSSNDLFDSGDYKFIFAQNEKLVEGDTIYTHYQGKRYTYTVTSKEVVMPTEVDKLVYPTDKPMLTLISCVPLGTALKRLLITAEQVSPAPNKAETAPESNNDKPTPTTAAIPGNSPTLFERIFGLGD